MKGLRAALKKDIRLFVSGSGLMALLLPVLLFLALRASGGELLQPPYIEAFAIAVRDEDNTPMSRSLIQQIEEIEIFSEVVRPGQEKSDEECFSQGCAAVITIPEDFFYTMYSMENSRVDIVLNGEMPLESALFQSVITSVMNIIAADQTSAKAVYGFCYGELTDEQVEEYFTFLSEHSGEMAAWIEEHPDYSQENIEAFAQRYQQDCSFDPLYLKIAIRNEYIAAMDWEDRPAADPVNDIYLKAAISYLDSL